MDLSFSPEEEAFRQEVRTWVADALPDALREKAAVAAPYTHDEIMAWHRILADKGWVAPHWPKSVGGGELDITRQYILMEELELAGCPVQSPFGLRMVGPLIMRFGTDEQKQRFIPKIISGDEVWCQGYSEPDSGSDLASLRTRAELDGDHYVVNGQKTWTTYAQYAHWIFALVRTDDTGVKQAGISFLLMDMDTPGIEVRPMLTLGGSPAFCDTFFTDVRVPKENLVGPLHQGWMLAKALLGHERTLVGLPGPVERMLRRVKQLAVDSGKQHDPVWRDKIARLEIRLRAHRMACMRAVAEQAAGRHPGPETSIMKLVGSTLQQEADELAMALMGTDALTWLNEPGAVSAHAEPVPPIYCYNRATTIYAGSNEIQKNIIARHVLGLPKG